jgi:hypothetical protein
MNCGKPANGSARELLKAPQKTYEAAKGGVEGLFASSNESTTEDECGQVSPRSLPPRDRGNGTGQIREYGPDGLPLRDFNFGHDHGFGDPHVHEWLEGVRGPGQPLGPNE